MQVNSVNNVSFGAKILPSRALESALELAQSEARTGTKEGITRASEFYNYLRTIENDKNSETFFIDINPAHYYPYMRLGKITRFLELFRYKENNVARSIQDGVKQLVEGKYLREDIVDEAKDVDLTKAFNRWVF